SSSLRHLYSADKARALAMNAGDDYELCFTLPASQWQSVSRETSDLTVIGVITERPGLWLSEDDTEYRVEASGYNHFGVDE
ncbi:MAG: hypothetical protein KGY54_08700, partial [Oleiphilaceae bacterium]|nr:hypothetical protein [Oleiphilaceae bacterium]